VLLRLLLLCLLLLKWRKMLRQCGPSRLGFSIAAPTARVGQLVLLMLLLLRPLVWVQQLLLLVHVLPFALLFVLLHLVLLAMDRSSEHLLPFAAGVDGRLSYTATAMSPTAIASVGWPLVYGTRAWWAYRGRIAGVSTRGCS
jgi:hypothetical protein